MDSHVWRVIYQKIREADRRIRRWDRKPKYSDTLIVAMYVWSVCHDRPLCWACNRENYASCFRPRRLPSISQFCRRVLTDRCDAMLQYVHEQVSRIGWSTEVSFLDGRAFEVGSGSKDPDAAKGPVPGGMGKGYRLHTWTMEDGRIPVWSVMPLNVSEKPVAGELLRYRTADGLILADGNYDVGRLYDAIEADGGQLLTPLPENVGQGHRHQSAARLRASAFRDGLGGYVYRLRGGVERTFAHTSAFGGGLAPLPPWVRTLPRVRRWIGTKLIVYHARWLLRKRAC